MNIKTIGAAVRRVAAGDAQLTRRADQLLFAVLAIFVFFIARLATDLLLVLWRGDELSTSNLVDGMIGAVAYGCGFTYFATWAGRHRARDRRAWASRFDAEAEIVLLSTAGGGRARPVRPGYQGMIHFGGSPWQASYDFPTGEVQPGETVTARLRFVSAAVRDRLSPGMPFEVREGRRVVGHGHVVRTLAPREMPLWSAEQPS